MNIVKIENGVAYLTSLNPKLDAETFVNSREDYAFTDVTIDSSNHYDFIDGVVVYNQAKSELKITEYNKSMIPLYIEETNKYMFLDNPYNLTDLEIQELSNYRKSLRDLLDLDLVLELPAKPTFI